MPPEFYEQSRQFISEYIRRFLNADVCRIADIDLSHIDIHRRVTGKPFLTAADIVMLREMKVGL
jgi:hypothetical protein